MNKESNRQEKQNTFFSFDMEGEKRVFDNPTSSNDAGERLPSLLELTRGYITEGEEGWQPTSKEDIIKNGTVLQKIRLLFAHYDMKGYYDKTEDLTEEEDNKLIQDAQNSLNEEFLNECVQEFRTLLAFGGRIHFFYKRFQASLAPLSCCLKKLDSKKLAADVITELYKETAAGVEDQERREDIKDAFISGLKSTGVFDDGLINFKDGRFFVEYKKSNEIYKDLAICEMDTKEALCDLKAYIMAAKEFIEASYCKYVPIPILVYWQALKSERFARYLIQNKKYFKSEINLKKKYGIPYTKEEEREAVVPDFEEVKATGKIYRDCKKSLKNNYF